MGKTTRGFAFKTKTTLVKESGNKKSKWKRKKIAGKSEKNCEKEEKKSALLFKIAKENGSSLAAEGASDYDKNKVSFFIFENRRFEFLESVLYF